MYTVDVKITGIAPLLQHRFPMPDLATMSKGGHQVTGAKDYTEEWREYFYANSDGEIFQPASHIEGALIKAAVNFKIQGKRGKSYKDLFRAAVFVTPDQILHGVKVPGHISRFQSFQISDSPGTGVYPANCGFRFANTSMSAIRAFVNTVVILLSFTSVTATTFLIYSMAAQIIQAI